jgi:hypothetical protein
MKNPPRVIPAGSVVPTTVQRSQSNMISHTILHDFDKAPTQPVAVSAWRSIGEVIAPVVKRLTVDAGLRGVMSTAMADRIVGSRWLKGA